MLVRAGVHATDQRTWPFGVAAIGAHLALVVLAPAGAGRRAVTRPVHDELSFEVERVTESAAVVGAITARPRETVQRAAMRRSARAVEPRTVVAVEGAAQQEVARVEEAERDVRVESPPVAIDPASAAGAMVPWDEGPGPADGGDALDEAGLERAIAADLRARAMTKSYVVEREIELRARPDGSYVHRGHGFEATIRPDGTVVFDDAEAVSADGLAARTDRSGALRPDGTPYLPELLTAPGGLIATIEPPVPMVTIQGRFDLHGELMRALGHDPWEDERRRFLEETEALRDELTDRRAAQLRARALRRLPARLAAIWRDRARSEADRRAAIFAVWDACADDEEGARAAARVERFVRDRLPRGSDRAFSEDELRALNETREREEPFDPYR